MNTEAQRKEREAMKNKKVANAIGANAYG